MRRVRTAYSHKPDEASEPDMARNGFGMDLTNSSTEITVKCIPFEAAGQAICTLKEFRSFPVARTVNLESAADQNPASGPTILPVARSMLNLLPISQALLGRSKRPSSCSCSCS